jgi:hypothetical protein
MASTSLPGRSVRPHPSRKRVSPETSSPRSHARQPVDEEALAAGRVTGGVEQLDLDGPDRHDVATGVTDEIGHPTTGLPSDQVDLVLVGVDRHLMVGEQGGDPLDGVAHEGAADVIGVEVGGEDPDDAHAVRLGDADEIGDRIGGIDDEGLARGPVTDEVGEVDHLTGHLVVGGEVPPGEELSEVELRFRGHDQSVRAPPPPESPEYLQTQLLLDPS